VFSGVVYVRPSTASSQTDTDKYPQNPGKWVCEGTEFKDVQNIRTQCSCKCFNTAGSAARKAFGLEKSYSINPQISRYETSENPVKCAVNLEKLKKNRK